MVKNSKYYFFRRLTKKYRLAILNDGTFEERIVVKITPLLVVSIILFFGFLAILSSFMLSSFKEGDNMTKERQDIVENYRTIDSLKLRIERTDLYLEKVKIILSGSVIEGDSNIDFKNVDIIEENINLEKTKNENKIDVYARMSSSSEFKCPS